MSKPESASGAVRDLIRAHARPAHIWLPILLVAIACGTVVLHVRDIMLVRPGFAPPEFRSSIAYEALLCWAVSTVCAYVGGFVVGRLYES
jgi:hypothetical protein